MKIETLVVRVKPNTVQLPHKVRDFEFKPDATVPEKFGKSLIKAHPEIYEVATGKPDVSKYSFKETFQVNEIQSVLTKLDEAGRAEVYEYAQGILAKSGDGKKPDKAKSGDGKKPEE